MKIPPPSRRRGSAVVIMLALLAIVFVLANANSRQVMNLNRELHRLDERQSERWQPTTDRDRPRSQQHDQTNAGLISREGFIRARTNPVKDLAARDMPGGPTPDPSQEGKCAIPPASLIPTRSNPPPELRFEPPAPT